MRIINICTGYITFDIAFNVTRVVARHYKIPVAYRAVYIRSAILRHAASSVVDGGFRPLQRVLIVENIEYQEAEGYDLIWKKRQR